MGTLYVHYSQLYSGGEVLDPSDRWSERADEHITTHFKYASPNVLQYQFDQIDTDIDWYPGDTACLVVAYHTDGDTFGMSYGYHRLVGAFKNLEDAVALKEEIEADYKANPNYDWKSGRKWADAVWKGYFSRLTSVDIEVVRVV